MFEGMACVLARVAEAAFFVCGKDGRAGKKCWSGEGSKFCEGAMCALPFEQSTSDAKRSFVVRRGGLLRISILAGCLVNMYSLGDLPPPCFL
jgi:hypothetical protein